MALATLLLPSSSSTASSASSVTTAKAAAVAAERSNSRRIQHQQQEKSQHHHGSKRTKKPPLSSPRRPSSLPPPPRTPPGAAAGSRRAAAAASTSSSSSKKKSPKVVATASSSSSNKKSPNKMVATASASYQQHKKAATSSSSSSWEHLKSLLSCRTATAAARVHDPAAPSALARLRGVGGSLCAVRDVVVDAAAASSVASTTDRDTAPLTRRARAQHRAASSSAIGHSSLIRSRGGLSGCYECRAINVEPMSRRYPRARELCACSQCGEVFTKPESLQHHQAIGHAVSELGPEDSGRNIVEIIFKSSWRRQMKRAAPPGDHRPAPAPAPAPACRIERVLKVHNPARTVARFEAYRDAVRARCRGTARAAADGNELLRFHSAPLACALGLDGGTSLCVNANDNAGAAAACCGVCTAIRQGFAPWVGAHPLGVRTTASSGRAHDYCCGGSSSDDDEAGYCRAMLVCRVIAGRVRRRVHDGEAAATTAAAAFAPAEEEEEMSGSPVFDSVAGEVDASGGSVYGDLEELFVANPRAILPCFVVIYRVLE